VAERACAREGVWIPQEILLGSRKDMDDIVESISRIQRYSENIRQIALKKEV
jgi:hypothetical protein